jgi:hypothetical protein
MRNASPNFIAANSSESREPRTVVKILNDHYTIYLTSNDDIDVGDVGAEIFDGVISETFGSAQRVQPERGWSSIGGGKIAFLDVGFTGLLKTLKDDYNDSLVNNKVELYSGYKGMAFADYLLYSTLNVTQIDNNENSFMLSVQDFQRIIKRTIMRDLATTQCVTSLGTSTGLLELVDASGLTSVKHDENWYNGNDNGTYGYFKVDGVVNNINTTEVVRWSVSGSSGDEINIVERGCFGTPIVEIVGTDNEENASPSEITDNTFLDLPVPVMIIALLTGEVYGQAGVSLPEPYHAGVDPALIDVESFENLSSDLWNFRTQFRGLVDEDAKTFIAEQCLLPYNLQPVIDQYGRYSVRRFSTVPANTPPVKTLTYDQLISISGLERNAKAVRNVFAINWSWDQTEGYYPLRNTFADGGSRALNNGWSDVYEINLRGIYNTENSNQFVISQLAEGIRARFSAPRVLPKVTGFMSDLFDLEIGDIVALDLYNHPDYASETGTTSSSFEVQGITYDFFAGTVALELFGTSGTAQPITLQGGEDVTNIVNDGSWEPLENHVTHTIDGNTLTITGNSTLDNDKFLWAGDVVVNAGVVVKFKGSVYLRYKTWQMLSGARLDGKGGGYVDSQGGNGGDDSRISGVYMATFAYASIITQTASALLENQGAPSKIPTSRSNLLDGSIYELDENGQIVGFDYSQKLYGNAGAKGGDVVKSVFNSSTGFYEDIIVATSNSTSVKGGAGLVMIGENFLSGDDNCIDVSGDDNTVNTNSYTEAGNIFKAGDSGFGWNGVVIFYGTNRLISPPPLQNYVEARSGSFNLSAADRYISADERVVQVKGYDNVTVSNGYIGNGANTDYTASCVRTYRVAKLDDDVSTGGGNKIPNAQKPTVTITPQYNTGKTGYADEITLQLNVEPAVGDTYFRYARFDWRIQGQSQWIPIEYDLSTTSNIKVRADGRTIEIRCTAYNKNDQAGGVENIEYVTPIISDNADDSIGGGDEPPIEITLPDIKRLELINRLDNDENWNKWKSPDAEFKWAKVSIASGGFSNLSGSLDAHLDGYKVRILRPTGEILREETVEDTYYIYTYEKNKKDTNGSPVREFIFEVQAIATTAYKSNVAVLTVSNPAPSVVTDVVATQVEDGVFITYTPPNDVDFIGVEIRGVLYTGSSITIDPSTKRSEILNIVSVDQFGKGSSTTKLIENPAPPTPTGIFTEVGIASAKISFVPAIDFDLVGTQYRHKVQGGSYTSPKIIYSNQILLEGLSQGTEFEIELASVDKLGVGGTTTVVFQTNTLDATDVSGLGDWATISEADQAFIEDHIDDNAIVFGKVATGTLAATESLQAGTVSKGVLISGGGYVQTTNSGYVATFGAHEIDGTDYILSTYDGLTLPIWVKPDGTSKIGKFNVASNGAISSDNFNINADGSGNFGKFNVASNGAISSEQFSIDENGVMKINLINALAAIAVGSVTFGSAGCQIENNNDNPRLYIGDGEDSYLLYETDKFELGAKTQMAGVDAYSNETAYKSWIGGDFARFIKPPPPHPTLGSNIVVTDDAEEGWTSFSVSPWGSGAAYFPTRAEKSLFKFTPTNKTSFKMKINGTDLAGSFNGDNMIFIGTKISSYGDGAMGFRLLFDYSDSSNYPFKASLHSSNATYSTDTSFFPILQEWLSDPDEGIEFEVVFDLLSVKLFADGALLGSITNSLYFPTSAQWTGVGSGILTFQNMVNGGGGYGIKVGDIKIVNYTD